MYKINDNIVYPSVGVCKIIDIKRENFSGEEKEYYILKPLYAKGETTLFLLTQGARVKTRNLLTKKEADALINKMPTIKPLEIENNRHRVNAFNQILKSCDNEKIISLIALLYNEKLEKSETGKGLRATDERIFNDAQKLINQELACSLGITVDEVLEYISKKIK